jgi:hypothetical protein
MSLWEYKSGHVDSHKFHLNKKEKIGAPHLWDVQAVFRLFFWGA